MGIKLASCELMNGYYTFSEHLKTNEFTIKLYHYPLVNPTSGVTIDLTNFSEVPRLNEKTIVISFPEGAYSASSLIPTLQALINSKTSTWTDSTGNSIPPSSSPDNQIINVIYNPIKAKFYFKKNQGTITNSGTIHEPYLSTTSLGPYLWGFDIDFRVTDDPTRDVEKNLGWLLGYEKSLYYWDKDYIQAGNAQTNQLLTGFNPKNILDFKGTKFFLLEITDYNKNYSEVFKYNTYKRNINYKDILAKIPNTVSTTNIIFEDSSDRIFKTRKYFGPVRISKLRIRLLDDYGRVVNLNGGDLVITLEIETLNMPYKNFRQ